MPAIAIGLTIGSLALYAIYAAVRASRKSKIQVGFLISRMGNVPETNMVEKLFMRIYTVIRILEEEKKNMSEKKNPLFVVRKKIIESLNKELSIEINDSSNETKYLATMLKDHIELFIKKTADNSIAYNELNNHLVILISTLENLNLYKEFEKLNGNITKAMDSVMKEIEAINPLDSRAVVLKQFKTLEAQYVAQGGRSWDKNKYLKEIQNNSQLTTKEKGFLIGKLDGLSIIDF